MNEPEARNHGIYYCRDQGELLFRKLDLKLSDDELRVKYQKDDEKLLLDAIIYAKRVNKAYDDCMGDLTT